ncbi:hypothetical protein KIS1582_4936 [Cytobacillus firmus]|uniref:Uncharacterized protein n=1 Tax=Cytobacillus firmus TaxID=1399 RepID=A0A800N8B3_CYTFI|nr:hypothetical protein KIS1582_4936 [Cytobacillus firmus]
MSICKFAYLFAGSGFLFAFTYLFASLTGLFAGLLIYL